MSRFAGKVVLVAGGKRIGRATADAFAAEGAKLVVPGRRQPEGLAVVEGIRTAGSTWRSTTPAWSGWGP